MTSAVERESLVLCPLQPGQPRADQPIELRLRRRFGLRSQPSSPVMIDHQTLSQKRFTFELVPNPKE